ncbi:hypothetical protein RJT34_13870 [Clitoria ternatea]|uniref:HMA domain-containing protein n=1 Tax=Clitoria ternatea TaxID=43366 RepID=A0AAN9PMM8_CLITE
MGKRNKEVNRENNENREQKESEKGQAVVLKAFIHCQGCSDKISKCLKGLEGVKQVVVDRENNRVSVRGEIVKDPAKILERLQKKYSKNVELISPKLKPDNNQKKEPEKKEQPKFKTVVLKMYIHCEGCAKDVKAKIDKMEGVDSVELDKEKSHVIVRGKVESTELVEYVKKKLRKHAEIIKNDNRREGRDNIEKRNELIITYNYPPQYTAPFLYPNQNFNFNDENVFACSIM